METCSRAFNLSVIHNDSCFSFFFSPDLWTVGYTLPCFSQEVGRVLCGNTSRCVRVRVKWENFVGNELLYKMKRSAEARRCDMVKETQREATAT